MYYLGTKRFDKWVVLRPEYSVGWERSRNVRCFALQVNACNTLHHSNVHLSAHKLDKNILVNYFVATFTG